jgi:hypothetical protein
MDGMGDNKMVKTLTKQPDRPAYPNGINPNKLSITQAQSLSANNGVITSTQYVGAYQPDAAPTEQYNKLRADP